MPRPRFLKLAEEKQAAILDAARAEFSAHGYRSASQNRIIEAAGVSKGAMYYYFDDKEDLYVTVIRREFSGLGEAMTIGGFSTPDEFWAELESMFLRMTIAFAQSAETIALARSVARSASSFGAPPGFKALLDEVRAVTEELVDRGQQVGAVRTDLPLSLIVGLALGLGEAMDYWFAEHWDEIDPSDFGPLNHKLIDVFKRVAAPAIEDP